jgi:hypothetical protein
MQYGNALYCFMRVTGIMTMLGNFSRESAFMTRDLSRSEASLLCREEGGIPALAQAQVAPS